MPLLLPAFVLATLLVGTGSIFKWKDADGVVHYGDRPPPTASEELHLRAPSSGTPPATAETEDQAKARQRLEAFEKAPFLYETTRDNQRRTLTDEERNQLLKSTRKERDASCD
jgi:hypothetical protein